MRAKVVCTTRLPVTWYTSFPCCLPDKLDSDKVKYFEDVRRQWGIKCLELSGCLHGLQGVNQTTTTGTAVLYYLKNILS